MSVAAGHVILAYAQWGRVQMADAEAEAAPRPEMQRLVAALRARLWQLQTELREQEVSEASSRAYCRGFCQVGAGQGWAAARAAGRVAGAGAGPAGLPPPRCAPSAVGGEGLPFCGPPLAPPELPRRGPGLGAACAAAERGRARPARRGAPASAPLLAWGRARYTEGADRLWAAAAPRAWTAGGPGKFLGQAGRPTFSRCRLGSVPRPLPFCSLPASGSKLCVPPGLRSAVA